MHSRRRFTAVAMWAMLALPISSQLCAQDNRPSAVTDSALARQAAEAWIGLIDVGNVDAAFASAAPMFRTIAGSAEAWRQFITDLRARLPVVVSRSLVTWEPVFTPSILPPGAPTGPYVRLTFRRNQETVARESVVLTRVGAEWRVAMYAISGP